MKHQLLIDCHTDMRDLPALKLAAGLPQTDICALTACFDPNRPSADSESLRQLAALTAPTACCALGARRPIIPLRPCNGGGESGEDYFEPPDSGYAWDLIYERAMTAENGLTILLLGPATNLAIALIRFPQLAGLVRHVVMAGGSFGFGDMAPYSERNVFEDAYACQILLRSGVPLSMIGLSAAAEATLDEDELRPILAGLIGGRADACLQDLSVHRLGRQYVIPSLVAAAWMLDQSVAETERFHVEVELEGTLMYGRTVIEWRHYLNEPEETLVAVHVKKEPLLRALQSPGT